MIIKKGKPFVKSRTAVFHANECRGNVLEIGGKGLGGGLAMQIPVEITLPGAEE